MEEMKEKENKKIFRIDKFVTDTCILIIYIDDKYGCHIVSGIIYIMCIWFIIFFMKKIIIDKEKI